MARLGMMLELVITDLAHYSYNKAWQQEKLIYLNIKAKRISRNYLVVITPKMNQQLCIEIYPETKGLMTYSDLRINNLYDVAEHEFFTIIFKNILTNKEEVVCNILKQASYSSSLNKKWVNDLEILMPLAVKELKNKGLSGNIMRLDFNLNDESYAFSYPLEPNLTLTGNSLPAKKALIEEIKLLNINDYEATLYQSYFYVGKEECEFKLLLAYVISDKVVEYLLLDNYQTDTVYIFLLDMFNKYGRPKHLTINNYLTYLDINKTLLATNIKVSFERYLAFAYFILRDVIVFIRAYYLYNEGEDIEYYMHYVLHTLDECIVNGYDPEKQKLADTIKEYYQMIKNNYDIASDSLVS